MTTCTDTTNQHVHRLYRMTCAEYQSLRDRADGRCEICGIPETDLITKRLDIDHDPAVGQWAVCGLLCVRCNSGFRLDTIVSPEARTQYLESAWYKQHPPAAMTERPPAPYRARRRVRHSHEQPMPYRDSGDPELNARMKEMSVASKRLAAVCQELRKADGALMDLIEQAIRDGIRQLDIVTATGVDRQTLRTIARGMGIFVEQRDAS